MGFNTLVTIKNSDLPLIENDPQFGAKVFQVALCGYGRIETVGNDRKRHVSSLSSYRNDEFNDGMPYNIQAGQSQHASHNQISVIDHGEVYANGHRAQVEFFLSISRILAGFGYQCKHKDAGLVERANVRETSETEWMHGWSDETFRTGTTSFVVLNDTVHNIRDDMQFGASFALSLRLWWQAQKEAAEAIATGRPINGNIRYRDSLSHNAKIITVTPADRADLIMVGGNTGCVIRPHLTYEGLLVQDDVRFRQYLENDRSSALREAKDALSQAGFLVRLPGRVRSEPPSHWSKKDWITKEDLQPAALQPDEMDAPSP